MMLFDTSPDGKFEMVDDWIVECIICGKQYRIDRNSLCITVSNHLDRIEHYFFGERQCDQCGERLFYRVKVYEDREGHYLGEDHECDDVDFVFPPRFRILSKSPRYMPRKQKKEGIMDNLAAKTFMVLRDLFFDDQGHPILFELREKRNTQDDPFDEYIAAALNDRLQVVGACCQRSSGPLIRPDMAVYKIGMEVHGADISNNPDAIIGVEVKKLERRSGGAIARSTGMDYNSTPPCGKVRIYTADDTPLTIKGYYLFACLEENRRGQFYVSAMCLCDGSILNDDFELYTQITGSREKGIGIGTYGDGANRNRPMLIFSNPLGSTLLDHRITLISGVDLGHDIDNMKLAWRFIRKDTESRNHVFYIYTDKRDLPESHLVSDVFEPFPTPRNRVSETQGRGKFRLIT